MTGDLIPNALFVIGFARSGTTVLQNALNSHPDIFLFGEPQFHRDTGTQDFRARYNAMHRAWKNNETKSTFCPAFFAEDADWPAYLRRVAAEHRYAGAKIVVNPSDGPAGIAQLFDFQCRHFYRARTLFSFRNPRDVLASIAGLADMEGAAPAPAALILEMFMRTVALYFRMLRTIPFVTAVFHEDGGTEIVAAARRFLGLDLAEASAYYQPARARHYSGQECPTLALVEDFYADFRAAAKAGFTCVQLEQNEGHFDPAHRTEFGKFVWRADRIAERLAEAREKPPPQA